MAIALVSTLIPIAAVLLGWLAKALLGRLKTIETDISDLKGDHKAMSAKLDGMADDIRIIKEHLLPPAASQADAA